MTCIVGLIHDGDVWMAADSGCGTSKGDATMSIVEPKVYRHGDLLIGDSGVVRACQVMRYHLGSLPVLGDMDPHTYLVTQVARAVRLALKEEGIEKPGADGQPWNECLIGFRGRLYKMAHDFAVLSDGGSSYMAVGSGAEIARGALYVLSRMPMPPAERLRRTLEAVNHHQAIILPPWVIEKLPALATDEHTNGAGAAG